MKRGGFNTRQSALYYFPSRLHIQLNNILFLTTENCLRSNDLFRYPFIYQCQPFHLFIRQRVPSKNAEEGLHTGADTPKPPSFLVLSSVGGSSAPMRSSLPPPPPPPPALHRLTCISCFDTCMLCS